VLKCTHKWIDREYLVKKVKCLLLSAVMVVSAPVFAQENNDPLEDMNRKVHRFNNTVDAFVFKPLAKSYRAVTPDVVETGIGNFFSNIGDVGVLVNDLLQLKFDDAGVDLGRLLFNSTVGLAGVFDVATVMGLEKNQEDFGQTLGAWGLPPGPYLVLPFFGPGSFRDSSAQFVPLDAWAKVDHIQTRNVGYTTRLINSRAQFFRFESLISGDDYIFIRDAYIGMREQAVNDGVVSEEFNDDDF